ncbi:AcrR family transcriptional regulator [Pseudomonas putida SJTE-1]|uniref:TetR/AcrR family transcriptional regulator n=2 Tax=Pseudomonas TaxID=286 RepID=A0A7L9GC86_9PSED|nr:MULTISPECIES: TetR/AcrR family transcriptional regulator [Pseudomonas]ANC81845.1 AcrR family transcriptional regulator [Pseudomonas putida B6-2]ANI03745.1 AcrR family transcriptional regulator [Pseudomonas putida SJTE-1]MBX6689149.1 TetR/AcrR family transcriptional regulator [Pseudomonas sp. USTB-Z]MDD1999050.1 TetR/AcrR family transcriptional regulator [Pseudomonas putida]MEB3436910.1 TetR/AcrR family transcriptional regulator [Pseudomonas sp. A2]
MTKPSPPSPARGPADHDVRDQIIQAAMEHFAHYGYDKTTVSDLAKSIGFSKAYIYKFFESKQAIGEVICSSRLALIMQRVEAATGNAPSASEKLRRLFRNIAEAGADLFFQERKLYDIAAVASRDQWSSVKSHEANISRLIQEILIQGRSAGEFERKTPVDEATLAIFLIMRPYVNAALLQHNLDTLEDAVIQLPALILRSLAP